MKTSFKACLDMGEIAAQHERKGEFAFAATKWRGAFQLAPNQAEREWAYARAEYCFKRGVDEKLIAIKKTRELDFKQFMEGKND